MESWKEVLLGVIQLNDVITDSSILLNGFIAYDGFPFTCVTAPSNVYDGIFVIPYGTECFSFKHQLFNHTVDAYVDFINEYKIEKARIIAKNIDFISKCPSLKYLDITPSDDADDNFDFSPLEDLPCVLYLKCTTEYGNNLSKRASVDYSKIKGLVHINMQGNRHINSNLVSTLKSLQIYGMKFDNLGQVVNSQCLDSLQIVCTNLKTLNGLDALDKLKHLEISYNRSLRDINALYDVRKSLKSLKIHNCSRIEDFSVLGELTALQSLSLYGSNELPNLFFINNMTSLQRFGFDVKIRNGDLSPCMNLPHAYCAKNMKHYNFRNDELPKNLVNKTLFKNATDIWRCFE